MATKAKEGKPREQWLKDPNPETILVIHSGFGDEIMTINKDTFDSKIHKRCNSFGQLLDEKGRVLQEPTAVAPGIPPAKS